MKTKRNKHNKNKTFKKYKHIKPSLKKLHIGFPLFASKKYEGSIILDYNAEQVLKYNDKCLMQNSSWFGDLKVAKSYKTKDNHIYCWKTKKDTNLLNINSQNQHFVYDIFTKTKLHLLPVMQLNQEQINKVEHLHPYLHMSNNEKALFEFQFCFGFITSQQQYEFMLFIKYLIQNKFIDVQKREGGSILTKLNIKINYYKAVSLFKHNTKFNRLSFYLFDKHAIMNLCKIVNNKTFNISGVYQKDDTSLWFPDLVVYKMDIQEYILFNPQDNLIYDSKIL
jgi:hypothetical protein